MARQILSYWVDDREAIEETIYFAETGRLDNPSGEWF
jgi:hypothetical protein